jgi:hypothetical protein
MTSDFAELAQKAYEAAQELEDLDDAYLEVVECYHERTGYAVGRNSTWPAVLVHMVVRMDDNHSPVYTYPAIEAGREQGLDVFDTVTHFGDISHRESGDIDIRMFVAEEDGM